MPVDTATSAALPVHARKLVREQQYRFDRKFGAGWINALPRLVMKISKPAQAAMAHLHEAVERLEQAERAHLAGDTDAALRLFGEALKEAEDAKKAGNSYDNRRSWWRECFFTNVSMLIFSTGLQVYYRRLKAKGEKPWDDKGNWWGEVKQFIALNVWYMGTVVAVMGGDFDVRRKGDKEARRAFLAELFILWAVLAGTFGGDQLLRKRFNIDPESARSYTSSLAGLLAGLSSNLAQAESMRGCSPTIAAVRGGLNGPGRYALAKWLLRWFLPPVPTPAPQAV
jgi:hypothetical protein